MDLYAVMTRNCNIACSHCYLSAGPGKEKETMSPENFETVLQNIPQDEKLRITLTGGEIFTMRKNLWKYLDILKGRKNIEKEIVVQTNGYWLDKEEAEEIIKKLRVLNVSEIEFASKDLYHLNQGLNYVTIQKPANLETIPHLEKGVQQIFPIGRGKKSTVRYDCGQYCTIDLEYSTLSMNWKGDLSPCCFGLFRIGNLIEENYLAIKERYEKDSVLQLLKKEGIEKVAKYYGMPEKEIESIWETKGTGGLCAHLFDEKIIEEKYRRNFD